MERQLLEQAYRQFLNEWDTLKWAAGYPVSYDLCDQVEGEWTHLIGLMVSGDLRETINLLNAWRRRLMHWKVWLTVLGRYEGEGAWTIRDHFVEPIVFWCMLQPSLTRDRMGMIATNAVHQANLRVESSYADRLDQDEQPGTHISRRRCEKQLQRIGKRWTAYSVFAQGLKAMDSKGYRSITRNFRNLANHGVAPRFELGETNFVVRSIVPKTETIEQGDGTYRIVEDPVRRVVSYGFGGTPPLSLHAMYEANEREFALAIIAFNAYQELLRELLRALKQGEPASSDVPHEESSR